VGNDEQKKYCAIIDKATSGTKNRERGGPCWETLPIPLILLIAQTGEETDRRHRVDKTAPHTGIGREIRKL